MLKNIVFTGGGTAGHVIPNIVLINYCLQKGCNIDYIGSQKGIEKELISDIAAVKYHSISCGKLRRYWSWQNFIDPFKIIIGILQSLHILLKCKPKIIFSKGGFVSFPVVFAGWCLRIPIWIHESDLTPGLANKLSFPFATKICVTFKETNLGRYNYKKNYTGSIVRPELFIGDPKKGQEFCKFKTQKPVILFIGGSQGSKIINEVLRSSLAKILQNFEVIHLCGKDAIDSSLDNLSGYRQYTYIKNELADLIALADLVVSRSGSNSVHELLALKKPHILIPLSKKNSRGDQVENAAYYYKKGMSLMLNEEDLTDQNLIDTINFCYQHRSNLITKMHQLGNTLSVEQIADQLIS